MAISDTTPFPVFLNISDDSRFVHQAMREQGFDCEFADLSIAEMQCTLLLAEYFKRSAAEADEWES